MSALCLPQPTSDKQAGAALWDSQAAPAHWPLSPQCLRTQGMVSHHLGRLRDRGLKHHHWAHFSAEAPPRTHGRHQRMAAHQQQPPPLERAHPLRGQHRPHWLWPLLVGYLHRLLLPQYPGASVSFRATRATSSCTVFPKGGCRGDNGWDIDR
jgi:hypothetical protein